VRAAVFLMYTYTTLARLALFSKSTHAQSGEEELSKRLNILIADDEEEIRDILSYVLKSSINCEIQIAVNGKEAVEHISKGNVDLILCDYNMPIKKGGEVYSYVLSTFPSIRYVMCSTDLPDEYEDFSDRSSFFGHIKKPNLINGTRAILERFKKEISYGEVKSLSTYSPIGIRLLFGLSAIPSDIFVSLSENKYVKVFNAGDVFDETDLVKYTQNGIDTLYAFSASKDLILEKIHEKILSISKKTNTSNDTDVCLEVHSLLVSTLKGYGIQEAIVPIVETHLKEAFDLCKSNTSLQLLLDKLLSSQESYLGKHSLMLAAISVAIAEKMEGSSTGTAQKLVVASLFHDIFLKEKHHNELIFLASKNTDEDFLSHPQKAADLLNQMAEIPPDVGTIVLEHHEVGEENGFPVGVSIAKTNPLSQLFTFSHYVVDLILASQKNGTINEAEFFKKIEVIAQKTDKYSKFLDAFRTLNLFN
jgi:response regulator RpfG family c-di-GMP phosphodiesterase